MVSRGSVHSIMVQADEQMARYLALQDESAVRPGFSFAAVSARTRSRWQQVGCHDLHCLMIYCCKYRAPTHGTQLNKRCPRTMLSPETCCKLILHAQETQDEAMARVLQSEATLGSVVPIPLPYDSNAATTSAAPPPQSGVSYSSHQDNGGWGSTKDVPSQVRRLVLSWVPCRAAVQATAEQPLEARQYGAMYSQTSI